MNVLDVHAVGWVVTRDLRAESARRLLGCQPRLDRAALDDLGPLWARLINAVRDDQRRMDLAMRIVAPRHAVLSPKSEDALAAFVAKLVAICPRLYARDALRARSFGACGRLIASFLCAVVSAQAASPELPLMGFASLAFFVVAFWSAATTFQLRVACHLTATLHADAARQRTASTSD